MRKLVLSIKIKIVFLVKLHGMGILHEMGEVGELIGGLVHGILAVRGEETIIRKVRHHRRFINLIVFPANSPYL